MTENLNILSHPAYRQNLLIHRYVLPIAHALLWVAALSWAGYAHICGLLTAKEALLASTLAAYAAYLCESGLGVWRVAASDSLYLLDFKRSSMRRYVWLNFCIAVLLSTCFLIFDMSWLIVGVIFNAGWQKYMDGRIPVRLQSTCVALDFS